MFDREKFGKIIKRINDTYPTQYDFADSSDVNRTYLSQYINMKLSSPPKPSILRKIANASKGITNYNELMSICGYEEMTNEYNLLLAGDLEYANLYFEGQNLSNEEKIKKIEELIKGIQVYIKSCTELIDANKGNLFGDYYINLYKSDMERAKKEKAGFEKILNQLKQK